MLFQFQKYMTDKNEKPISYVSRDLRYESSQNMLHVNAHIKCPPYVENHENKERENIYHIWILLHTNIMFVHTLFLFVDSWIVWGLSWKRTRAISLSFLSALTSVSEAEAFTATFNLSNWWIGNIKYEIEWEMLRKQSKTRPLQWLATLETDAIN